MSQFSDDIMIIIVYIVNIATAAPNRLTVGVIYGSSLWVSLAMQAIESQCNYTGINFDENFQYG